MDCNRPNVYQQSRKITKSLKIGCVQMSSICSPLVYHRNIDSELAFLLPLMAGSAKTKIQIFVVDKETEDLVGKVSIVIFIFVYFFHPSKLAPGQVP